MFINEYYTWRRVLRNVNTHVILKRRSLHCGSRDRFPGKNSGHGPKMIDLTVVPLKYRDLRRVEHVVDCTSPCAGNRVSPDLKPYLRVRARRTNSCGAKSKRRVNVFVINRRR